MADIIDLAPLHGAGISVVTPRADMSAAIRRTFDRLYRPGTLVPGHGHNFILYGEETASGLKMTVGVLDRTPGGGDPDVKVVHVPGGRVLTAPHWGDYGRMGVTYGALQAEVKARRLKLAPLSLEIYGDWSDDPAKVRTDLHLYLAVGI